MTKATKAVEFTVITTWEPNPDNCIPYDGVSFDPVYVSLDNADAFQEEMGTSATRVGIIDMPEDFVEYGGFVMPKEEAEFEKFLEEHEQGMPY